MAGHDAAALCQNAPTMTYLLIKTIHSAAAVVTIAGFMLRGYWMLIESDLLQHRVIRIAPHIVDAALLVAGIAMLWMLHLNPFTQSWLLAKFGALVVYIVLGAIALRRGPTLQIRLIAFVGALSAFAYIVGAAFTKSPASWLAYLTS